MAFEVSGDQEFGVYSGPSFVIPSEDFFSRLNDNLWIMRGDDNYKIFVIDNTQWFQHPRNYYPFQRVNDNPTIQVL